jgi:Rrf2 family nitric oxide-sensitive transcriptional repressor
LKAYFTVLDQYTLADFLTSKDELYKLLNLK